MVRFILLLLIVVPAIEIGIFLLFGKVIGVLPTVLLIIFTGFAGAYLAKKQGLETVKKARLDMQNGRLPGEAILDGICIFAGGILLLAPGFLTDVLGLLLLIPFTRKYLKNLLKKGLARWMENSTITIIR